MSIGDCRRGAVRDGRCIFLEELVLLFSIQARGWMDCCRSRLPSDTLKLFLTCWKQVAPCER